MSMKRTRPVSRVNSRPWTCCTFPRTWQCPRGKPFSSKDRCTLEDTIYDRQRSFPQSRASEDPTLVLVHPHDDHDLVSSYPNKLRHGSDTSPRQLRQQNHALDVVVLQQPDVGAHVGNGPHIDHDDLVNLGVLVLVLSREARVRFRMPFHA